MTARHHMVLRDEDIRNLKLSDTFCIQQKHNAHGSQLATGLVFAISRGKTNKHRVRLFATAFRHKDFLRCTVGAFAFYMFERFHAFYAPKNPVTGAFYMAHFNKPDEPYFIERNIHTPPLDLQRAIFPWIEDIFNVDQPGRKETWKKELDNEMEGIDPNRPKNNDTHWTPTHGPVKEGKEQDHDEAVNARAEANALNSSVDIDRCSFLKLLVRMRRVIIQDAVCFMEPDANGKTLTNSLIRHLIEDVFGSDQLKNMFYEYRELVRESNKTSNATKNQLQSDSPLNATSVSSSMAYLGQEIATLRQSLEQIHVNSQAQPSIQTIVEKTVSNLLPVIVQTFQQMAAGQQQQQQQQEDHQAQLDLAHLLSRYPRLQRQVSPQEPFTMSPGPAQHQSLLQQQPYPHQQLQYTQTHPQQQQSSQPQQEQQPLIPRRQWQPPATSDANVEMSEAEAPTGPGPELKEAEKKKRQREQESRNENRGYRMALDHGNLTLQEAWDEFHGPCKQAKLQDKKWPYTTGRKKVLYRRTKLMELIKERAMKNSETPAETIEALTT
ncbi:hypothetical protein BGZ82_003515, partial [Podila clonocystis]